MFVKEAKTLKEIVLISGRRVKKEMVLHIVFTHIVQMVVTQELVEVLQFFINAIMVL